MTSINRNKNVTLSSKKEQQGKLRRRNSEVIEGDEINERHMQQKIIN
jgi:hypothetical protein